jgi:hypothetical protein
LGAYGDGNIGAGLTWAVLSLGIVMLPQSPNHAREAVLYKVHMFTGLRDTARDHQHDLVNMPCRVRFEDVGPDYY